MCLKEKEKPKPPTEQISCGRIRTWQFSEQTQQIFPHGAPTKKTKDKRAAKVAPLLLDGEAGIIAVQLLFSLRDRRNLQTVGSVADIVLIIVDRMERDGSWKESVFFHIERRI